MSVAVKVGASMPTNSNFYVDENAENQTFMRVAPGSNSATNVAYNISLPSFTSGISNQVVFHYQGYINITATKLGTYTITTGPPITNTISNVALFSLADNPVSSIIANMTCNIANQSFSQSMLSNLADAFNQYKSPSWNTTNPAYSNDSYNGPTDANGMFAQTTGKTLTKYSAICKRSSVNFVPTLPGATGNIVAGRLYFDIYQPIELLLGQGDKTLYGFSKLAININFVSSILNSMVKACIINDDSTAYSPVQALGTTGVTFNLQDILYTQNSDGRAVAPHIYRNITYNISQYTGTSFTVSPMINSTIDPANLTQPILPLQIIPQVTQSILLDSIPHGFLIFASVEPDGANLPNPSFYPRLMLPITSLSINFLDKTSLLQSMTQYQLYELSVKNGLNTSFDKFRGTPVQTLAVDTTGAVPADQVVATYVFNNIAVPNSCAVYVKSTDLSMPKGYYTGQAVRSSFQATISVANNILDNTPGAVFNSQAVTPTIYVIPCFENKLTIDNDNCTMTSDWAKDVSASTPRVIGGGWSDFWDTFKDVVTLNVPAVVDKLKNADWGGTTMSTAQVRSSKLF